MTATTIPNDPPLLNQLAFSTLGCPEFDFSAVVALASRHRVPSIELRCLGGTVLAPDNFTRLLPDPASLRAQLQDLSLQIACLGTSVKLLEPSRSSHQDLLAFARLADQLHCPFLRIFDGGSSSSLPGAKPLADAAIWFQQWQDLRTRHGLRAQLCVETHDGLVSIAAMQAARSALPDLPVLWDLHHTWRAGTDLDTFGELVADSLVHVHLKDSIARPSPRKPFTYVPPGQGEFPWTDALALLRKIGFAGAYSFEWERQWHPDLAPLSEVMNAFVNQVTA